MKTLLKAPGIMCENCAKSIRTELGGLAGVQSVDIDVEQKTVAIEHDEAQSNLHDFVKSLDAIGFDSTPL